MFKLFSAAARQHCAVAQAEMGTIVEKGHIIFAQKTCDRAECTTEPAVKKHGVFAPKEFRNTPFQFAVPGFDAEEIAPPGTSMTSCGEDCG